MDPRIEKWLETLFLGIDQGVVLLDREGKVVLANPATEEILGRPFRNIADPPEGNPKLSALNAHGKPMPIQDYAPLIALRTGQKVRNSVVVIYNPKLKAWRWISVDANPIFEDGASTPAGAFSIFTDITELKNTEMELRQNRLHLSLAQRIASVGSAASDFKTGKWDWSEETFRIYGVDPKSFVPSAEGLGSLVHPEDWPRLYENVPRAQAGAEPEPVVEYRIKRPDGAERIVRRVAEAVRDDEGRITGIVATVQDVTELRTAQREKKALESQLYHAQRLDSLGILASGIAHDLNNTLVPVVALSDVVLQSLAAGDPNRPLLELIREGGTRASELVAQVLTFARRGMVEHQLIDLRDFLAQSLRLVRAGLPKTVKIVEDLRVTAKVEANQGQLNQVLLNLFSNAAQAIGEAPGYIYLSTAESDRDGRRFIQLSVADTGCGMSEEIQARIFEPFFTTRRVGQGSGLGLSVVHGIVASHGGQIQVQSAPGQGARFDVFLPVAG